MKKWVIGGVVTALLLASLPVAVLLTLVLGLGGASNASAAACQETPNGSLQVIDAGGPIRIPIAGRFQVMSEYNPTRRDPVDGVVRPHKGIDLASIPKGADIVAMKGGVITYVGPEPWGALTVEMDHGNGLTSRYLHLQRWTVAKGQKVQAGERIGIEGSTGHSTGSHLHWEIRVNGALVNPRTWSKDHGLNLPPVGGQGTAGPTGSTPGQPQAPLQVSASPSAAAGPVQTQSGRSLPDQVGPWSREQLKVAAAIVSTAEAKGLDAWTTQVGVMTAMGESSLSNPKHGDAVRNDTIGSFQQGPEWGPLAVRMNPAGAAGLFFDALVKVPNYRQLAPTIAAHRTQRNADPYHYAKHWDDAGRVIAAIRGADPGALLPGGSDPNAAPCIPTAQQTTPTAPATQTAPTSSSPPAPARPATTTLPPAPAATCPSSGLPAENLANKSALRALRCTVIAFPDTTPHVWATSTSTFDLPVKNFRTSDGRVHGWLQAQWVQTNAASLGVKTVIFDSKIWSIDQPRAGWRPYTPVGADSDDTIARRDHVEVRTA